MAPSTINRVTKGSLQVNDFGRRRSVTLRRGQTYLPRPSRTVSGGLE
jgi:hypothetical protein